MQTVTKFKLVLLVSVLPIAALGHQQSPNAKKEKEWEGTLTSVGAQNKTITAKKWYVTKTFNVGDNCAISVVDKKQASLSDLSAGDKVRIRYQNVDGVLVADRIAEPILRYSGTVKSVDPKAASLTLETRVFANLFPDQKTMRLADDCEVILANGKDGSTSDLKPGDRICVAYELPGGSPMAYRIRERSSTLVAAVDAIDLANRTVKAKEMFGDKKFELGDHCQIIANGKENASLRDLTLGKKYRFTFEKLNGVNVVNRIAPAQETTSGKTAQTT